MGGGGWRGGGAKVSCYIKEMSLSEVLTVKKQTQKSLLIKQFFMISKVYITDGFIYLTTTSAQDQSFADVLQNRCLFKMQALWPEALSQRGSSTGVFL